MKIQKKERIFRTLIIEMSIKIIRRINMQQIKKKLNKICYFLSRFENFFLPICQVQSHLWPIFTLKNRLQNLPAKMILKMLRFKEIVQPDDPAKNGSSRS